MRQGLHASARGTDPKLWMLGESRSQSQSQSLLHVSSGAQVEKTAWASLWRDRPASEKLELFSY